MAKGKDMSLELLFQPEGNIAFLDAEFNAGMLYSNGQRINEIISVGIIVCDRNYQEVARYETLVSPLSKVPIFPVIKEMTGITNDMLKGQPDFVDVSNQITELIKHHRVNKIYTWGAADKHSFLYEKENYFRRKKNRYKLGHWAYINMCEDISGIISSQMLGIRGGLSINVENLMFICEIDRVHEHSALSDAIDLYQCVSYLKGHYPIGQGSEEFLDKRELVNQYYQDKSMYNSFRRFKNTGKGNDLYGKWEDLSEEKDIRIKALEDDIKFLKGEISYDNEFDSIQEYFNKNK